MNQLKHAAEFRSVLKDYKPSPAAQKILSDVKLVLLTAPTAGGRNTIMYRLVETGDYYCVVSDTTRKIRIDNGVPEKNGLQYWFRSEDEILEDLKKGAFFEAQIIHNQQVSGTSMREIEKVAALQKIALNDVDTLGIPNILAIKPDAIGVFIIPPSFEEWLRRINSRGAMHPAEKRNRFETAAEIYEMAKDGKYPVIINDNLDVAVDEVDHLARLGKLEQDQAQAREIAEKLYLATKEYLKQIT